MGFTFESLESRCIGPPWGQQNDGKVGSFALAASRFRFQTLWFWDVLGSDSSQDRTTVQYQEGRRSKCGSTLKIFETDNDLQSFPLLDPSVLFLHFPSFSFPNQVLSWLEFYGFTHLLISLVTATFLNMTFRYNKPSYVFQAQVVRGCSELSPQKCPLRAHYVMMMMRMMMRSAPG